MNDKYPLLSQINSPADLRLLPEADMPALAREIRAFLIERIPQSGGHLASNLGIVELTLALHREFDTPTDHLIFDVGHQSYVHKLLTGRRDLFDTLRTPGGLSGFTRREESEYDVFGAGHSSTSLSAALGFARADRLQGRENYTVAVVGDGAYTGGMIHEALNNCSPDLRLILILNENEMSISRNIGGFARYIARIRNSRGYSQAKGVTQRILQHIPLIGKPILALLRAVKQAIKNKLYSSNYFEEMGLYYLGPADGNDYEKVARLLRRAKKQGESVILHLKTTKGKGYAPAEEHPENYHNIRKGELHDGFSETAGKTLTALGEQDARVCAITAAMREGTGLSSFFEAHPARAFDVGIAEEHALTFAAGLAAEGMKPYMAVYSTFLQRAYDNILHDIALQNLPVRILIDRAGLAGADGATHHGIFDVAFLSHIPQLRLLAPATLGSLRAMLKDSLAAEGPLAIRYQNLADSEQVNAAFYPNGDYEGYGVRAELADPAAYADGVILTYGTRMAKTALAAASALRAEGKRVGVILLETLKPYDATAAALLPLLPSSGRILFLEEGIRDGGAGVILGDRLQALTALPYTVLAIRDHFAAPLTEVDLDAYCGISTQDVLNYFRS